MKRRRIVSLGCLGALAWLAGCSRVGWTRTPSGTSVETRHWSTGILEFHQSVSGRNDRNPDAPEKERNPYTAVFTDGSNAIERLRSRENAIVRDAIDFIEATDFDASFLVIVDWDGSSSSHALKLDRVARTDGGLRLSIRLAKPLGGQTDDLSTHTLAVRITDDRGSTPDEVSAEVHDSEIHRLIDRLGA